MVRFRRDGVAAPTKARGNSHPIEVHVRFAYVKVLTVARRLFVVARDLDVPSLVRVLEPRPLFDVTERACPGVVPGSPQWLQLLIKSSFLAADGDTLPAPKPVQNSVNLCTPVDDTPTTSRVSIAPKVLYIVVLLGDRRPVKTQ